VPTRLDQVGITSRSRNSPTYYLNITDVPPRPAAPLDETAYTLTIEEAANYYSEAGFPRPLRHLQKYCARGDLESRKVETPTGEKYLITPESVERHISYIKETSGRTMKDKVDVAEESGTPGRAVSDYAFQLEKRIAEKDEEIRFLRSEGAVKNEQIKDSTARDLAPLIADSEVAADGPADWAAGVQRHRAS